MSFRLQVKSKRDDNDERRRFLSLRPKTDKEYFIFYLRYRTGEKVTQTGYGQKWPEEARGEAYYIGLAEEQVHRCGEE